jgi:hypothetical protein
MRRVWGGFREPPCIFALAKKQILITYKTILTSFGLPNIVQFYFTRTSLVSLSFWIKSANISATISLPSGDK